MTDQSRICLGATIGAVSGAAVGYLFFTARGRAIREQMEPAVDNLRHEFTRFEKTIEKLGELANDGMRVVNEFNAARAQYPDSGLSH